MNTPELILLDDSSFQELKHCPLRWRWTDPRYAEFTPAELDQIKSLTPAAAALFSQSIRSLIGDEWLHERRGDTVLEFDVADDTDGARIWLEGVTHERGGIGHVAVSRDDAEAVLVPPDLFVNRWDDFCYPGSDDVIIVPESGEWIIQYFHEDRLYFARSQVKLKFQIALKP